MTQTTGMKVGSPRMTNRQVDSSALEVPDFERIAEALGGAKPDSSQAKELSQKSLPPLNYIAQLILEVDSHSVGQSESEEEKIRSHNRKLLAAQLGCRPEDLQEIVDSFGDQWQEYVLEARIRLNMHSTHMRDVTWDRLEAATLRKLTLLIEQPGVKLTVAELLAVAKTANTANRGDRKPPPPAQQPQGGATVQMGVFIGGNPDQGVLPAGDLGKISLNLSQRVLKQLGTPKTIDGQSERVLDNIEMMGIKDIHKIGEQMDREIKEESK